MKLKLYHYWRSSSSWRVRWALELKKTPCELVPINLLSEEAESEEHLHRNPLGYVPVLEILDNSKKFRYLAESIAIIEWLDETWPTPPLLPGDPLQRARIRQLAEIINADTHPLQNYNPQHLHAPHDAEKRKAWAQYWICKGLHAYETVVKETAGIFSVGDSITLADLCLIPQCNNAKRYEVPLENYPTIARINSAALKIDSCKASAPARYEPKS